VKTSVDIFSLGLVFYYAFTGGHHPYGDFEDELHNNIKNSKRNFNSLIQIVNYHWDFKLAEQLIFWMLHKEEAKRPTAFQAAQHPLFWNETKIETFFNAANDKIQKYVWKNQKFIDNLNSNGDEIFGENWRTKIDKSILQDLERFAIKGKPIQYDGKSVVDLIRAMRNAVSSNLINQPNSFNSACISERTSKATIY
jgi:serine/threonine protein kinase